VPATGAINEQEVTGVIMKAALRIPEEVAISLVDDSYEGDAYERVDEVEGDFMEGGIIGNQLIFLYRGKLYRFYFADFGIGNVEVTDSPDSMVNCEEVRSVTKEIPARTECQYVPV
jgi:hypothetical protein